MSVIHAQLCYWLNLQTGNLHPSAQAEASGPRGRTGPGPERLEETAALLKSLNTSQHTQDLFGVLEESVRDFQ